MIRFVAATRLDHLGFLKTQLGRSPAFVGMGHMVKCKNARGLPEVYNAAIADADLTDTLVFAHDDVHLADVDFNAKIAAALNRFDVAGVAGNTRRLPGQDRWHSGDGKTIDGSDYLSGAVDHGGHVDRYGPAPREVKILDGVFLAARAGVLRGAGVRFDERFRFHFYDLDFCRSCEKAGLRMGTWPITISHASTGSYGSPEWLSARADYFAKWVD